MITMALHGEGEPQPTLLQVATQAGMIELFTQWQTYRNGVHMDWDTFRSIDFKALAIAVMTAAGWEFTADEVPDMPQLRKLLTQPSPFGPDPLHRDAGVTKVTEEWDAPTQPGSFKRAGRDARMQEIVNELDGKPYGLSAEAIAEHGKQVQG